MSTIVERSDERGTQMFPAGPPYAAETLAVWWAGCRDRLFAAPTPFESAVIGGALADRLGYAFAAGYEAALTALVPSRDRTKITALCATESGGAHPRAISTTLEAGVLRGEKTFVTLADQAEELLVLASAGKHGDRHELVFARVDRKAPGVVMTPLGITPFVPEIPHASVRFEDVREGIEVLPGDGWTDYVRPFRTVEDAHVHAALLSYLIATGRRCGWPRPALARATAVLASIESICRADPSDAATHVALGGAIDLSRALVTELEPAWESAPEDERARWRRDRPLLEVAGKARALRLERAWETVEVPSNA